MVKITDIRRTKRRRMALFDKDGFLFSIDEETLAKNGVEIGQQLSPEQLGLLREQSDARKAKDQALRYLSLRAYAERELYEKLQLKFDAETAAAAVTQMRELELLDDAAFALEKAKGMAERGKSCAEIRRKLMALGIEPCLIEDSIGQCDADDGALALEILQKRYMDKLLAGETEKVKAALARRGFGYRDIQAAIAAAGRQVERDDGRYTILEEI